MRARLIFIGLTAFLLACGDVDKKNVLLGTWKTDSIYTFYNGFRFTRHDVQEEPLIHYQEDGKLMMTKNKESRFFSYQIQHWDSLVHRNLNDQVLEKFIIVKLNADQLILREELVPVFRGHNQERYELRYFSRVKE